MLELEQTKKQKWRTKKASTKKLIRNELKNQKGWTIGEIRHWFHGLGLCSTISADCN